jgi:hypothetical protein
MGLLIIIYNLNLYGSFLGITAEKGTFSSTYFLKNFKYYFSALNIIYPLMFFSPLLLLKNNDKKLPILFILSYLIFFSFYYFHDSRPSYAETLIVGQRLIQIILPVWILLYVKSLQILTAKFSIFKEYENMALIFIMSLALTSNYFIHVKHDHYLKRMAYSKELIQSKLEKDSTIYANSTAIKLFGVPSTKFPSYKWKRVGLLKYLENIRGKGYIVLLLKNKNDLAGYDMIIKKHSPQLIYQGKNIFIYHYSGSIR